MIKSQTRSITNVSRIVSIFLVCLGLLLASSQLHAQSLTANTDTLQIVMDDSSSFFKLDKPVEDEEPNEVGSLSFTFSNDEIIGNVGRPTNIDIASWGGAKTINLNSLNIEGDLTIRTGSSNDYISLADSIIGGKVNIVSRNGDDFISITNTIINGRTTINTSKGFDYFIATNSIYSGSFRLITGDGLDLVDLTNLNFAKNANIYMGLGDDFLFTRSLDIKGEHRIITSSGDDSVYLDNSNIEGELTIKTGADMDFIDMNGNTVEGRVLIKDTSGSNDYYIVSSESNVFLDRFTIIGFDN